jgi:hypothetical protein
MAVLPNIPLLKVLKTIGLRKNPGTYCFFLVILFVVILLLAKATCPTVRRQCMRQFHLTSPDFGRWSALQLIPAMYSFGNEFWYATRSITDEDLAKENSSEVTHAWLNHYPLRIMTFSTSRHYINLGGALDYITIRSGYQSDELTSHYVVERVKDGFELKLLKEQWASP